MILDWNDTTMSLLLTRLVAADLLSDTELAFARLSHFETPELPAEMFRENYQKLENLK